MLFARPPAVSLPPLPPRASLTPGAALSPRPDRTMSGLAPRQVLAHWFPRAGFRWPQKQGSPRILRSDARDSGVQWALIELCKSKYPSTLASTCPYTNHHDPKITKASLSL